MKYVSIDIETTGLDPENCAILELAAIIEDTKTLSPREQCPTFHRYINHGNRLKGEPYALVMNAAIIKETIELSKANDPRVCGPSELMIQLDSFFKENGISNRVLVAGKNFATFDREFLRRLPNQEKVRFQNRVLDPVTLYTDFLNDDTPPNTDECKRRAGIISNGTHRAKDDAWEIICLLRAKYGNNVISPR